MNRYEHTSVVLHFAKKTFALSRGGILQGLAKESSAALTELGIEGWELVSVVPFSGAGVFVAGEAGTDAALAFLKRSAG